MRAGIKSILLILACAVLFGAGFRPRPLPAAAYAATGYSFAGALRAWKESLGPPLPEAVLLDVPVVYQWPEMPNGCEATALTMLLQYYGFAADKLSVAYDYIPRSDFTYTWFSTYGPDPASAYAGDPALFGFYCLAPAVAEGANRYLAEQDSTLRAVDISGADGYVLRRSIAQGRPVVVWATIGFEPVVYSDYSWRLYSDSYPRSVIRRAADRMRHLPAALRGNGTPCSRAQRSAAGCVRSVSGRCKALVSPTVKTKNEKRPAALTEHRQSSRTLDFPALQIKPFLDVYSPGTARMPETAIRPLHFIPLPTQVPLRPKEAFRRVPKQA